MTSAELLDEIRHIVTLAIRNKTEPAERTLIRLRDMIDSFEIQSTPETDINTYYAGRNDND